MVVAACTEASVRGVSGSSDGGAGGRSEAGAGSSSVEGGAGAAGRGGNSGPVGVAGSGGHDSGSSHGGESAGGSSGDGGTSGDGQSGASGVEQGGTTAAGAGAINDAGNGGAAGSGTPPDCRRTVLARDYPFIQDLALDGGFVYWTTYGHCPLGSDERGAAGKVSRVALSGGPAALLAGDYSPDPGLIQRVAKTGGIPEVLATAKEPRELAISSAGIFWIEEPSYNQVVIRMLDWSARALPITVASAPAALALAARGDTVYWTSGTYDSGSIHRIRLCDSKPVTIVDGEPGIGALALDEQYVYWATAPSEGEIARTCR